jgi:calcineurin-like phosphoesterase family protein
MNSEVMHLHGHVHLPKHQRIGNGRSLDVGVDGNDIQPYLLENVINLLKNQPIDKLTLPKDHHVKRI